MLGGNQGCRGVRCQGRVGRLLPSVAGGPSGPVHVPLGASVCSPRRGPPTRSGGGAGGVQPGSQMMRGAPRVRRRWNHAQYCLPSSAPLPLAGGEGSLWEFSHCRMNSFNKYF